MKKRPTQHVELLGAVTEAGLVCSKSNEIIPRHETVGTIYQFAWKKIML